MFWHKNLGRAYVLSVPIDSGKGTPIVLLHGLGGKALDWGPAVDLLADDNRQILAFDLLGFGSSPKPQWSSFDVDVHAKSVAKTIKKMTKEPVILVGHSMGAIIAVRVARNHPKLVKQLILYEIPVYSTDLVDVPRDPRNRAYKSLFTMAANNPKYIIPLIRLIGKVASNVASMNLDKASWEPFEKSLRNTVMQDTVYEDVSKLDTPVDLIFGNYDFLVMRRTFKKLYKNTDNIAFHKLNETHKITRRTGRIIASILKHHAV